MALKKEITEQIRELLRQHPNGLNITAIVRHIQINRNTAGRYLENLMVSGQVEMRHYGMAKIYRLAQRVPLSAMLSISSELIMLLDTNLRVIYANEPMLAFLGTSQKDLYGRNIEFTPCVTVFDDAFDLLKKKVKDGTAGKEWTGELSIRSGDTVFSCRIAPAVFEEGQRGVSVLLEDITRRKRADEELREKAYFQMQILNGMYQYIALLQPDGTMMRLNRAAVVASGLPENRLIGIPFWEGMWWKISAQTQEQLKNALARAAAGEFVRYEVVVNTVQGPVTIDFSLNPIRDKTGTIIQLLAEGRDITDRKLAEKALLESEDRYRKLVEISPDAIIVHKNGKIIYMNPAALHLIGASALSHLSVIAGKNILDIIHPDYHDIVRMNICKDLTGERTPPVELQLLRLDGTSVVVEGRGVKTFINGEPAVQVAIRDITERKRAEEAIKESEATARALINAPTDSILLLDTRGVILDLNETAVQKLGKRREDLIGACADDALPGDVAKIRRARISRVIETKKPVRFADERDGIWFDTVAYPIPDKHGEVSRIAIIARDITDRKTAEDALRVSEERYRGLVEGLGEAVYRMSVPDGRYEYFSPMVMDVFGYPGEAFLENPFFIEKIIHPDSAGYFRDRMADLKGGKVSPVYEYKIIDPQGNGRWIRQSNSPVPDSSGKIIAIEGLCRNVTQRRQAEEALRESERHYRTLFDSAPIGIGVGTKEGVALAGNETLLKMTGYSPEEIAAKNIRDIYQNPKDREKVVHIIQEQGELNDHIVNLKKKDGTIFTVNLTIKPVVISGKKVFLTLLTDITQRIRDEEALRRSEKRFHDLAELLPQNVWECDIDGKLTFANRRSFEMYRYTPEDFEAGLYVWQMIHPDDRQRIMEDVLEALKHEPGEFPDHHEYTAIRKDGSTFPIIVYHVPIVHENAITGMRGIGIDLTGRKQMEEALREMVRAFRMLAENTTDIITRIAPDGSSLYLSSTLKQSLGYEAGELPGRSALDCFQKTDLIRLMDVIRAFQQKGADEGRETFSLRHRDGHAVMFEADIRVIRDPATKGIREFIMTSREIAKDDRS